MPPSALKFLKLSWVSDRQNATLYKQSPNFDGLLIYDYNWPKSMLYIAGNYEVSEHIFDEGDLTGHETPILKSEYFQKFKAIWNEGPRYLIKF